MVRICSLCCALEMHAPWRISSLSSTYTLGSICQTKTTLGCPNKAVGAWRELNSFLCGNCTKALGEGEWLHAGAMRSITCIAMEEGATLVNVPRDLFISFITAKPRTLQIYLHKVSYQALEP